MTYKVSEQFPELKEFTLNLPKTFDNSGLVIHNSRNVIKKIDIKQRSLVVKNFKGMYLFNRLAYSFFRKSKAARSYLFSGMLNERGITTPAHVGWIDCYDLGLLTKSYFVSVFLPYQTLEQVLANTMDEPVRSKLFRNLAAFALRLHHLGIYQEDFSVGNILVSDSPFGEDFALVDLNRIKFRKVAYEQGLRNFNTLRIQPGDMNLLLREYAALAGRSPEESIDRFWKYNDRTWYFRRLRRKIRRNTISRLEKILGGRRF